MVLFLPSARMVAATSARWTAVLLSAAVLCWSTAARAERGAVSLGWFEGGASGLDAGTGEDESDEDRMATLGAAFIAEVLGPRPRVAVAPGRVLPGTAGLRDIIASVEAGRAGYDAVVWSAKVRPSKPPTRMTLDEIAAWIAATPGQHHAIGRYQIVPKTLRSLIARAGLRGSTVYSPRVQDQLADMLLADAGLAEFLEGRLDRTAFMENVAAIWAGLPARNGRSVYHGLAGNAAGMTWATYQARMAQVFPLREASN